MSQKDGDTQHGAADTNQDGMVQLPPPSYSTSTNNPNAKYEPSSDGAPSTSFYQAQPVSGQQQTYAPPGQQQTYAPPEGAYIPPSGGYAPPSGGYAPPAGVPPQPYGGANPNTVVYVVDGNNSGNLDNELAHRSSDIPVAMICFIFG
ncbi:hypothetical protein BGX23_009929 [Mortierella sp. AD031]|nr:hypothetical protein BGX23_009929 [Mortierella sp. AD031]